uniref:Uncharacterized protein n=1 Tax=Rhizophora mucronata TaxID=61149 RepID=A0A2P2PTD5_RHIMU
MFKLSFWMVSVFTYLWLPYLLHLYHIPISCLGIDAY